MGEKRLCEFAAVYAYIIRFFFRNTDLCLCVCDTRPCKNITDINPRSEPITMPNIKKLLRAVTEIWVQPARQTDRLMDRHTRPIIRFTTCHACFLNVFTFCKKSYFKRIFKKKATKPRPKVRFFTHFLTYVRFVVQVYFIVPNGQLCIIYGQYLPHQGAPGGCHSYTLKSQCSSITNSKRSFLLLMQTIAGPQKAQDERVLSSTHGSS